MNTIDYFGFFVRALTVKKVTETFDSFTSLVESAISTLSKILLLTKERASTPVIYAPWSYRGCLSDQLLVVAGSERKPNISGSITFAILSTNILIIL